MAEQSNGTSKAILQKFSVALLTATFGLLCFVSKVCYSVNIDQEKMKVRMEMNDKDIRCHLSRIEKKLDIDEDMSSVPTGSASTP